MTEAYKRNVPLTVNVTTIGIVLLNERDLSENKVNGMFRNIERSKKIKIRGNIILLCSVLVRPHLDYCGQFCWGEKHG